MYQCYKPTVGGTKQWKPISEPTPLDPSVPVPNLAGAINAFAKLQFRPPLRRAGVMPNGGLDEPESRQAQRDHGKKCQLKLPYGHGGSSYPSNAPVIQSGGLLFGVMGSPRTFWNHGIQGKMQPFVLAQSIGLKT